MMKRVHAEHGMELGTARLSEAEERHRSLDARVQELGKHAFLTPQEQLEMAELKKQKLKAKDELEALRRTSS